MPIGVLQQGDDGDDAYVDNFAQGGFPGGHPTGDHWSGRDPSPVGRLLRMLFSDSILVEINQINENVEAARLSSRPSTYDVLPLWAIHMYWRSLLNHSPVQ